mgnify:CR=1 FL=1
MHLSSSIHVFRTQEELSGAVASRVAGLAGQAARSRRRFAVALSGGSLLDILSPSLAASPLRSQIDWSVWEVFWADERCVPLTSPESNFAAANRLLLEQVDIPRQQIHAVQTGLGPGEAAKAYQETIKQALQPAAGQLPRLDLVLLGLGQDGHTASLFPGHELLQERQKWVAPVFDAPKPPAERITLTLPLINQAREVIFVAAGQDKAAPLGEIFCAENQAPRRPAALVRPTEGNLHWFLDSAAADKLGPGLKCSDSKVR